MQTNLAPQFQNTHEGLEAKTILGKCVHCGFCTATCPTYQLLGDELDGPRGRIYLIKEVLEGKAPTRSTQQHLDRCLTCRNCESTCPSGVQYGALVDIGRKIVENKVKRTMHDRALRWALKKGLNSKWFAPAMRLGQAVRPLLPQALQNKVPKRTATAPRAMPHVTATKKVLMPIGCVQPAMAPNIDAASKRVLAFAGIECVTPKNASNCCGAIKHHLNDHAGALTQIKQNIDAWLQTMAQEEIEVIVSNASGCGVMVKDYGHLLQHDSDYADKAKRVSSMTKDIGELLPEMVDALKAHIAVPSEPIAYHPPCTLQHGQKLKGGVEQHLRVLGFAVEVSALESHLCCGSAGTYSVLQPKLSYQLRDRKLGALPQTAGVIASSNVGCITHLQSGTHRPVKHWIELIDEALST